MRRRWLSIGLVVVVVAGTVGALIDAPSLALAAYQRAAVLQQIDEAERRWIDQGITSYRIEVGEMRSTWHMQWNTVVVRDGQVTEQSGRCIRAPAESDPCKVEPFKPAEYTVPGLFAIARELVEGTSPPTEVRIRWDDMYGFPRSISIDTPGIIHGDHGWGVEAFTPL